MSEKRFVVETVAVREKVITDKEKCYSYEDLDEIVDKLNEQQATINILLEELVNAQQQGYVIGFLHKNEHCKLIPKELENE